MNSDILIQLVAIIALISFAGSFHSKTRKEILLWQILSLFFWVTHYSLLGAWTGALLACINGVVTVIFLFKDTRKWLASSFVLYLGLLAVIIGTIFTWQGYYSLFALFGVMAIIISKWQDVPNRIKLIAILASIFWIIYDVFVGSWGGIVTEVVIILSVLVSLLDKNKLKK